MSGIVALVVLFMVFSFIAKIKRAVEQGTKAQRPDAGGKGAGVTQGEGVNLQDFLRKMQQAQEMAAARQGKPKQPAQISGRPPATRLPTATRLPPATRLPAHDRGPMGRPSRVSLPSAQDIEDRTSLEVKGERQPVDLDEAAEAVVQRRIDEAEKRDYTTAAEEHPAFDVRIRQETVDKTGVVPKYTIKHMREALVWREILGPPLGMRDSGIGGLGD